MSGKDASDGGEPVGNDGFEEELAAFLAEDWQPRAAWEDEGGFDLSDFLAGLYHVDGVLFLPAVVEVPLAAFVAAQRARVLRQLQIDVDDAGQIYLAGVVVSGADQVMLASVSFASAEDDDGWER